MADISTKRENNPEASDDFSQRTKKTKVDNEDGRGENGEQAEKNVLSTFQTTAVLSDSAREKTIFVHGQVNMNI